MSISWLKRPRFCSLFGIRAPFGKPFLAFCASCHAALAEKRVALVVGNSAYENVVGLTNPAHDAAAIADMFKRAGFDVVDAKHDLKNAEMRRALREFTDKARDSDIAVIYYAGHGIEVNGVNYLVPVDAMLERDVQHVKGVASASAGLREKARTLREAMSIFLVEHDMN